MVQIIWSDRSQRALTLIKDFISQDNPMKAKQVLLNIVESTKKLKIFSEIGRFVPELTDLTTRELIVLKKYRIVYTFEDNIVNIIMIFHTSQEFRLD